MNKIKIIYILIYFSSLVILFIVSLFFNDAIFIPSNSYKQIGFIVAPLLTACLIYVVFISSFTSKKVNFIVIIFTFIIFTHLYLLLIFNAIPAIFQNFHIKNIEIAKQIVSKHKTTRNCSYQLYIEDAFYYGRICTSKEQFNKILIGDTLIFHGNKNFLGLYLYSYDKV